MLRTWGLLDLNTNKLQLLGRIKMSFSNVRIFLTVFLISTILSGCAGAIIVGAGTGVGIIHDRRTAGTVVEDQAIEFKAAARLRRHRELKSHSHINITSYNRIVLITGEAETNEIRDRIATIVSGTPSVRRIHNEVTIGLAASTGSRLRDSWITTKAKTSLFKIKRAGFDPTRIKILTENNTVYLMGLVTKDEGNAAVNRIKHLKGVKRVVKIFEYISHRNQTQSHGTSTAQDSSSNNHKHSTPKPGKTESTHSH